MSLSASTLRKLALLNLSSEQMAGVLDILADSAEADEARRAAQRDRTRKHRAQRDRNVTVTSPERYTPSDKEAPHTPKEITSPPSPPKGGSVPPRAALESVLDAERAQAVVDHRQRLRKPLTAHAAKLLAKRLAEFPDPNAAADRMIEKGWQSIEADWGTSPPQRATAPPTRRHDHGSMWADEAKRMGLINDQPPDETTGYDLAGTARGHDRSTHAIELSAIPTGRSGH